MAVKDLNQPAVQAVSLKLPEFWANDPEVWFTRVESLFNTRGVSADGTKYDYVVSVLDNSTASEVKSVLVNPPAQGKYDKLKSALLDAFGRSQAQKDAELLSLSGLGDRKPTALLRKIRALNNDAETLRRALFLAQLPSEVRGVLAGQEYATLEALAEAADRVVEARQTSHTPEVFGASRGNKTSQSSTMPEARICSYHTRFGSRARSCRPGCIFSDFIRSIEDRDSNTTFPHRSSENSRAGR